MSDKEERKKVINDLELIKQSLTDVELKESLTYAIESIKVDMVYELMHEKVDFIEIPEGATNEQMLAEVFPHGIQCNNIWKNAPYKKEEQG